MALLCVLFGLFWIPMLSLQTPVTSGKPPSLASYNSEIQHLSDNLTDANSTWNQISTPPHSAPSESSNVSLPMASINASESTASQDDSTKEPLLSLGTSSAASRIPVPVAENSLEHSAGTGGIVTSDFLETSNGTGEPSVTTATNFLVANNETSGFPVTMATRSVAPSNEMTGPPATMTTRSLEPSNGPPATMTTRSLESSSGPTVTLKPSNETNRPSVTMATSSEVSSVASSSPVSHRKLPVMTTPHPWTDASLSPALAAGPGSRGMLLVPILVALLVVIVLMALLLLWRHRQKQRTGVLTLHRGGKRNGVADAWAGPAQVPEEAMRATVGGSGADKGSGIPETEGSGQKLSLTTFFGRRKSHQGSLALEELKPGSGPSLKGEEEPLVGSEDEVVEAPTSNGPEVGDGAACE
ncbi:PREDICTED: leukosialin [Dipodomys ordii]|uniref:Leukosialin n=1 Tax=Dipodomys ordii TaxID=10020 RepID=A0A1S3ERX5_DIPOR|nr:PREDICTED: leukosialin [Dipodomys ordii]